MAAMLSWQTPHTLSRPYTKWHKVPHHLKSLFFCHVVFTNCGVLSTMPHNDLQCYHAHTKFYKKKPNKLLQELIECRVHTSQAYFLPQQLNRKWIHIFHHSTE